MQVTENRDKRIEPDRGVFSSSAWHDLLGKHGIYLDIGNKSQIKAQLILYGYKKLIQTVVINAPFSAHCGLEFKALSTKASTRTSEVKRVSRSLADHLIQSYPNAVIDFSLPPEIKDIQPFKESGFEVDVRYTYRLDLMPEEEDLFAAFSTERRKNVKDAQKKNFTIQHDYDCEKVIERIKETLENSGLKYDYNTLRRIVEADISFTVATLKDDEVLASAVIVYDKSVAYYIAGGADKSKSASGAAAQVLWEAIKRSKAMGVSHFDFCGSSVPSIEKFFRGFGGELTPYFRIRKNTAILDFLKSTKDRFS